MTEIRVLPHSFVQFTNIHYIRVAKIRINFQIGTHIVAFF